ncbi:MAG: carbohydrate binding family 9 domain-containing protein [Acidobacteria bacterium]|nr:carbohydrate binding family 9 domain-containing protein [Acidobacteriota bacterium]
MKQRIFLYVLLLFGCCDYVQAFQAAALSKAADAKPSTTKLPAALPIEKTQPVVIKKFASPPVIDGKLDDAVWKQATLFKDFYQVQPGDNIAPSQKTEVWMGYDSKFLYLGFRAYDDPDKVRATVPKRDQVYDDDNVKVYLDTFNDKRKAYEFMFNPYGVQGDAILTDGIEEDFSIDLVHESKGVIDQQGYTVEVAIPFKSLRYVAGKDKIWGVNFYRRIQRFDREADSWMPISRDKSSLLSQFGQITGLEGISNERTIELIPSLTLSESGKRVPTVSPAARFGDPLLGDPGRMVNAPITADLGFTMKFGITPTITLDATVNPDFAQVEADAPVLTANQRFPIFYPEKRPFFLEGIDIFQTPIQALNTRAIVDPDYALKLTGKQGRNSFGLLLASDNAPGNYALEERNDPLILPSIQRFLDKNAAIAVLRYKRDIGKESSLGFIGTSYDFIEKHNRVGGIDGRLRLDKQTTFSFQVLGTTSRRYFYDANDDRNIYRSGKALAYSWNVDKTGRNFGYRLSGDGKTRDYRADVGFFERTNFNSNNLFLRYSSEPKAKAKFISWRAFSFNGIGYDWQGRTQSVDHSDNFGFTFTRQIFFNVGYNEFYERLFEGEFGAQRSATRQGAFYGNDPERSTRGRAVFANFNMNPSKKVSFGMFAGHRWNIFDFDFGAGAKFPRVSPAALLDPNAPLDPGAANTFDLEMAVSLQPTNALKTSLTYNRNRFTRNDTGRTVLIDNIYSSLTTYQFTRFLFARARLDYDSLAASVRGQYLFGWTPNPGTAFYVGYNDTANYNGYSPFTGHFEPGFRRQSRTFFIKTSYLFRKG